jgi:hypothetical protein
VARVRVGEQQVQLVGAQLALERIPLLRDLTLEVGLSLGELVELDQVTRPALEAIPRRDELAVLGRLPCQLARASWVVPRAGLGQLLV